MYNVLYSGPGRRQFLQSNLGITKHRPSQAGTEGTSSGLMAFSEGWSLVSQSARLIINENHFSWKQKPVIVNSHTLREGRASEILH